MIYNIGDHDTQNVRRPASLQPPSWLPSASNYRPSGRPISEAQFTTSGNMTSSLSPEFAMEVRDLLLKPPAAHPYDTLKTELIKRTAASKQIKLQQLISGEELGNRKPTQHDELGTADDANFLREPFLQRLPANVRMVLASADGSMDLADMADKVMEVATPTVAALSDAHPDASEIKQNEVARLADLVSSLTTRSRRRSPSQPRRPNPPPPGSLCWYHTKVGQAAQKCREPCSWGNSEAGR